MSLSIQRIERAVGQDLVIRRPNVMLTPAGEIVVAHARTAIKAFASSVEEIRAMSQGDAGEIRLGFPNWLAPTRIPALIAEFSLQMPKVVFSYSTTSTRDQLEAISDGRLDAGFVREPQLQNGRLELIALFVEPFVLALPEHAATMVTGARLQDFKDERFLLFPRDFSPGLHDMITALLARAGRREPTTVTAPDWFAILALVRAGGGLALVPASMSEFHLPGLSFLPLEDLDAYSTIAAVKRAGGEGPALQKLIEWLQANASLSHRA